MIEAITAETWLESAPAGTPLFAPSPTVEEFIHSVASGPSEPMRMLLLQGSRGEGKTSGGLYACIALGQRLLAEDQARIERGERPRRVLPVRVAVVRDTWANLNRTTLVSFEENATKGMPLEWRDGRHEAVVAPYLHFYFFGLDNRADADKLQGFQCGILWLEEVAPAAELATGIPAEALGIGITSVRQGEVPKRVIITFNPPDEDHWVLSVEKTLEESGQGDIAVRKFVMKPGEKALHFRAMALRAARSGNGELADDYERAADEFEAYRRRNRLALESIGRDDLVQRLVEGKVGGVILGEPIVSNFSYDLHTTDELMPLVPGSQMVRAWDAGLTPSTVWIQITPAGNLDILGSRTSINRGMAEHILYEVRPFEAKYGLISRREMDGRPGGFGSVTGALKGFRFRDIGDSACFTGNQATKREDTPALMIENLMRTSFEPGPIPWAPRRESLRLCFGREGATKHRARLINIYRPENKMLIQGLNGRAHYAQDQATGRINPSVEAAKRVSHVWFQSLDALGYALAVLFPAEQWLREIQTAPTSGKLQPPRSWLGV